MLSKPTKVSRGSKAYKGIGGCSNASIPSRPYLQVEFRIAVQVWLALSQSPISKTLHWSTSFFFSLRGVDKTTIELGFEAGIKNTYGDIDAIVGEDQGRVG